jgi:PilZ domain
VRRANLRIGNSEHCSVVRTTSGVGDDGASFAGELSTRLQDMTPEMEFECLLVSGDPAVCRTLGEVLRQFSIRIDHCPILMNLSDAVTKGTHELVVLDWEGEASAEVFRATKKLQKRLKPTVLGIHSGDRLVPGAHVQLRKPVTGESAKAGLRAAYARMLFDYRRNARHAIMTPLIAVNRSDRSLRLTVTDVGEGGLGLFCKEALAIGDELSFSLQLPDTSKSIHIQARIIWTRGYGSAGCEFLPMPPVDQDVLREWLESKTRVKKPLISV